MYTVSAISRLCFPMYNKNYKENCCYPVSLCEIFFVVSLNGLTLPVSVTMAAVCSVKMFYIAARMGEEESWLSGYCATIGKCNTVQIMRDRVTFNVMCCIY